MTDLPDCPIVTCMEREYYLKDTGEPIKLEPYQRQILNEALRIRGPREQAYVPYRTLIWSQIKKSGKTEIGAAVTYAFERVYGGQSYSIANDERQASARMWLRVHEMLEIMREVNPELYAQVIHPDYADKINKGSVIRFADAKLWNAGPHTLEYIPVDYRGEAGGMQALTVWDELWGYDATASTRLWTEMQPIPTLPVSLRMVTTYAGYYGESTLLYAIYEACTKPDPHTSEKKGLRIEGLEHLPCFAHESYFCYWDEEARMPWHTPEFLEQARNDPAIQGREQEYMRIWQNQWVTGMDAYIPLTAIDAMMDRGAGRGLVNNLAAAA